MSRPLRRLILAGGLLLLVAIAALAVLARVNANSSTETQETADRVSAPLAVGTELTGAPRVPRIPLRNASGAATSLSAWKGKWVVLAPSMTLCNEDCPLTTGALLQLTGLLRQAGLSRQVVVAEATVDPWRDRPARLRAYEKLTGADFQMLTGTARNIRRLWRFFHVYYQRVPEGRPADIDWWTHKPETFDVDHSDNLFLISPSGREVVEDDGMADVHGQLSNGLRGLLDGQGREHLAHPAAAWTAQEAMVDLDHVMNRTIPVALQPSDGHDPSAVAAQRELAGSPHPLAALHAQAGQLIDSGAALGSELRRLRGRYPIVLNVWASYCTACQAELDDFGAASARLGTRAAFLGADFEETSPSNARSLLKAHPLSYPSFVTSQSDLAHLAVIANLPTTVYIARDGQVANVHLGLYQTAASLDNDIEHYALGVAG